MKLASFNLTKSQKRKLETSDRVGNHGLVFRVEGPIDKDRLQSAVRKIENEIAIFSCRYLHLNESLQMIKIEPSPQGLKILEPAESAESQEAPTFSLIESLCHYQFRLDSGAPYLFALVISNRPSSPTPSAFFIFSCHPALMDRFSLKPLMQALSQAYSDLSADLSRFNFKQDDLLSKESEFLSSPFYPESLNFWMKLVRNSSFEWQPGKSDEDLSSFYFSKSLTLDLSNQIHSLCRKLKLEPFQLLLFSFHILLERFTGAETILTSFFHKIDEGTNPRICFNENKLPLKSYFQPGVTADKYFQNARGLWDQMHFYGEVPAQSLARELIRHEPDFKRVTNILFTEDCLPYEDLNLGEAQCQLLPVFSYRLEDEDLAVHVDSRDTFSFHVLCRSPQHIPALKWMFRHFEVLLGHLPEHFSSLVFKIPVYNDDLMKIYLQQCQGAPLSSTELLDPVEQLIKVTNLRPDHIALESADEKISYQELLNRIQRLASVLPQNKDQRFGLLLTRGAKYVEGLFASLWSGTAYIPLDPSMSAERITYIAQDVGLHAMLVDQSTLAFWNETLKQNPILQSVKTIDITELPLTQKNSPASVHPETLAYVIYTSGTTGRPKGVPITRINLSHLMSSLSQAWPFEGHERYCEFASFTFDATILGFFYPLIHGLSVVITPAELRTDPEALFQFYIDQKITHAELPPAMLARLPKRNAPDLKRMICGGEAIDEEAVRFWSKAVELCNCYGPTEGTVMCTMNYLTGAKTANQLGRPIPGYQTFLLDELEEPAPLGGIGEICVGGDGVSPGYLNRPELNSQKFAPHALSNKLYRSGDLGRFLPSGDLEFLGRADFQVKIRGFRIELGEIESVISEQPEVHQSFVSVVEQAGEKALAAWYTSKSLSVQALKQRLSDRLPHYMVPGFLHQIESFPLTLNGKIDRSQLIKDIYLTEKVEPQLADEVAAKVQTIWQQILQTSIKAESHFFQMGGHSLSASLVCSRLSKLLGLDIRPRILFSFPKFEDFCRQIKAMKPTVQKSFLSHHKDLFEVEVPDRMIRLMYSRALSTPDDNTYNITSSVLFGNSSTSNEGLDPVKLQRAFQTLISRNPLFQSAFVEKGSQLILQKQEVKAVQIALTEVEDSKLDELVDAFLNQSRALSLGVQKAPLWRARLLHSEKGRSCLLFSIHHSLFDGWSLNLFLEELAAHYEGAPVPTQRLTLFDFYSRKPNPDILERDYKYWLNKLKNPEGGFVEAKIPLPVLSHQSRSNSNLYLPLQISAKVTQSLKMRAESWGVTLPPLLFAIFNVWIWRLSNQEDFVIGYPYAGRDEPGTEEIYGAFVKIALLRTQIQALMDFKEYVLSLHHQMIEDKDHLSLAPYDTEIPGSDSLNVIFSLQSGIGLSGKFAKTSFFAEELPSLTAKGDLTGIFYERPETGTLDGRIEFDGAKFSTDQMQVFLTSLETLINFFDENPKARVSELKYLNFEESKTILSQSIGPDLNEEELSIPEAFSKVALASLEQSQKIALRFKDKSWTYKDLLLTTQKLSLRLQQSSHTGERVGICVEKSDSSIILILSLLGSGLCYVPLDPTYPVDRLKHFVQNSNLSQIIYDESSKDAVIALQTSIPILLLSQLMSESDAFAVGTSALFPSKNSEAYVIHTSGSTGLPKGVLIRQDSLYRMIRSSTRQMDYPHSAVSPLYGSFSFDTSVIEIFLPLLNGATLVIVPEEIRRDPDLVFHFLKNEKISHAILSPALLQSLPLEPLPDLKMLGFGGDSIDEKTAHEWSRRTQLVSCYGPTETTVQCSVGFISGDGLIQTIGRPAPGYRIYLLNPLRQLVPRGAVGELYIGGEQSAVGYLNLPELTRERFVQDPFQESPYAKMYRAGDLGRWRPDGNLEFLGRADGQIKVRGFRIELGEIENRMSECPGVQRAVCQIFGQGQNKYIVGFFKRSSETRSMDIESFNESLRETLIKFLPEYMIPSIFAEIEQIPTSLNGKVDRKKLVEPQWTHLKNPPHQGPEEKIAKVFSVVLHRNPIPRDQSFFHLGGNSLLAVRLQKELFKTLNLKISIAEIYQNPTVEKMALLWTQTKGMTEDQTLQKLWDDIDKNLQEPFDFTKSDKPTSSSIQRVLLTGANGFLGIYLASELLRRNTEVTALVRASNPEQGLQQVLKMASRAGIDLNPKNLKVVTGDFTQENLGLSLRDRSFVEDLDGILHCGAFVHHLHSYTTLEEANVRGTRRLLELALKRKTKRFGFVSTIGVGSVTTRNNTIPEELTDVRPPIQNGYILSKWAAERWVEKIRQDFGLSSVILRAGNITGDQTTGFSNYEQNHFWLLQKGCWQLGHFPDWTRNIEMMPVDHLARIMVEIFLLGPQDLTVSNLTNPNLITTPQFFQWAQRSGLRATVQDVMKWQKNLDHIGSENGLYALRDFYLGDLSSGMDFKIEQSKTIKFLKTCGIDLSVEMQPIVDVYLKYLIQEGFLRR